MGGSWSAVRRGACAASVVAFAMPALAHLLQDHLRQHDKAPADYLLSKLSEHRIVIAGESHWQRKDAELIGGIVPELRSRNVALAMEVFLASSQGEIDALISAPAWDQALANRILRAGDWPYVQYRDILQAAWAANRVAGAAAMRILALGPPEDWRKQKIHYDAFMAERVRAHAAGEENRVLVYCGMHHAFTKYMQVERLRDGRATEFMERMGNILWRKFGQEVFLVALHKPDGCGEAGDAFARLCAPLGGAIDCAADRVGGKPVGFDLLGSPIAEAKFDAKSYYAAGHPLLRMIDYADGYIWQGPVDEARLVELIPLEEYAPEAGGDADRQAKWRKRADDLANPLARASWTDLPRWREGCAPPALAAPSPK